MILGFDFTRIFSFDYLFNLNPPPFLGSYLKLVYLFFGLFLLAGVVTRVIASRASTIPPLRRFYVKSSHFLFTIAVVGLLLVAFRQGRAYFLGAPFWLLLLLLGAISWAVFLVKYLRRKVPEGKAAYTERKAKEKYLP
jgi:FtsH-binding integral membrane protein